MSQDQETIHTDTNQVKDEIIQRLKAIDSPLILQRVETVLNEAGTIERIYHLPAVQKMIQEEAEEDLQVRKYQSLSHVGRLSRYDALTTPFAFYVGILSLLLIGALVTALTEEDISPMFQGVVPWLWGLTGLCYLLVFVDAVLLFYFYRKDKQPMQRVERNRRLLALVFPPLRIGTHDISCAQNIWLPFWHWCRSNEGLFLELKRRFVLPMIGIALLIVPVLIIEWKFLGDIKEEWPALRIDLILEAVQTFIWCAFTFEFILMISVSKRKLGYVKKNWIDLLIILLPFVSFLRTLRISQIARLKYATRSFKLRGVITKARQGLIFMDFLQRIFRLRPESEVRRIYRLLRENQQNREDLERKLKEAVDLMERNQSKKKKSS